MAQVLLAFVAAFALNFLLTPMIIMVARRNGWYDDPDHRTVHTVPVPRLGGVGIVFTVLIVCVIFAVVHPIQLNPRFWFVISGLYLFHAVGVVDDFLTFRAIIKLGGQIVAAMLIIAGGLVIQRIGIPFTDVSVSLGPLGPIVTLIWIAAITNAVNLMDGMDGLAGGISLIGFVSMAVYFVVFQIYPELLFLIIAIGALSAFLCFNRPRASVFMGDGGSLWLGAVLAILPLVGGTHSLFSVNALLPLSLLAIPIADTIAAIWRRIRDKKSVYHPDKKHLHHKLIHLGYGSWAILAMVYTLSAIAGVPIVLQAVRGNTIASIAIIIVLVLVVGFFWCIHIANRRQS